MQTGLVLVGIEVRTPELQNSTVVPPQEEADCSLENIGHNDICPEFSSHHILWRKLQKRRYVVPLLVEGRSTSNIDGD